MNQKKKMSDEELMEVNTNLHTKSTAELLAIQEKLLASLPLKYAKYSLG